MLCEWCFGVAWPQPEPWLRIPAEMIREYDNLVQRTQVPQICKSL